MKKYFLILCLLISAVSIALGEDRNALLVPYEPILDEWASGLDASPDMIPPREMIEIARHCVWNSGGRAPGEVIGYSFADMDGDGIPELMIGDAEEPPVLDTDIFEIYTLVDGRPVSVLQGWERFRVQLAYDSQNNLYGYYGEGSSGAGNTIYRYAHNGWANAQVLECNDDFESSKSVWTLNGVSVDQKQAEALIDTWQKNICRIPMVPFIERGETR